MNFLVGAMRHSWKAVEQVGPSDFYLWGRFVTAALGTATVALVYQAGLRWGPRVGLAAAGLLAVMPMHVRESHFVLTDVPMTFAVVLTLLLSLRAAEQPTLRAFVAAGAAAGLAAGIKYNALMAFSMPLVAALARGARAEHLAYPALFSAAGACVVAFFVTTPFALIDLPAFLNGFGTQAAAFSRGRGRPKPAGSSTRNTCGRRSAGRPRCSASAARYLPCSGPSPGRAAQDGCCSPCFRRCTST